MLFKAALLFANLLVQSSCVLAASADPCTDKFITLPWGTYKAETLGEEQKICVFRNVRFGEIKARFGAPSFPPPISDNSTVPEPPTVHSCIQVQPGLLFTPSSSASDDEPGEPPALEVGDPLTAPLSEDVVSHEGEDCLFLDVYVPTAAFARGAPKFPVVNWVHGGAYAFGSKAQNELMYSGQGIIESSGNKLIVVIGNYRIGTFGWLAGTDFQDAGGQPNAGLHDQRLVLQWIQDHIHKVNGDKTQVSAWGESAGGGSLLHHLTRGDGNQDPLFKRAFIQSPAFQWKWDPKGEANKAAAKFSELAKCGHQFDLECLRKADIKDVIKANELLFIEEKDTGLFPVGPAIDGDWVKKLPAALFAEKGAFNNVESLMISHVGDEASLFTPKQVTDEQSFNSFLEAFMPQEELTSVRAAMTAQYDCRDPATYNGDWQLCLSDIIRDVSFTCNARQLHDAYRAQGTWMMQYDFPAPNQKKAAIHGTDLLPLFLYGAFDLQGMLVKLGVKPLAARVASSILGKLAPSYQKYVASHALHGNPNRAKAWNQPIWFKAAEEDGQGNVAPVMQVRYKIAAAYSFFDNRFVDTTIAKDRCGFWTEIAQNITSIYGHGESVASPLLAQDLEL